MFLCLSVFLLKRLFILFDPKIAGEIDIFSLWWNVPGNDKRRLV